MPILKTIAAPADKSRVLTAVLFLTVICWVPYFAHAVVPIHDTLYVTESFHCFYSALRSQGELIRWIPYGNYGMTADFYQLALHPMHYAVGIAGLLLGVDDTLLLAKIAMLANELLLALGLYLLSRELYSLPLTCFLVSIGGVLSVSWFEQAMFNLFIFYLLPLVMFLVLRFFKTGKPNFLLAAGITEICSLLGNVTYAVPLHFWVLLVFAAALAWEHPQALKAIFTPRMLLNPWLWVFVTVIGVVGSFMAGATANLALLSPGRDPTTGRATLENFLDYGRQPMSATVFGLATGGFAHGPNTYYVGLLTLAMFAYALATESRKTFLGIAVVCVALVWLSIGGWFATLIFYLPGMSLFRHIALIYGIIGIFLLLGAGFGFERMALRLAGRATTMVNHPLRRLILLIAFVGVLLADFWLCRFSKDAALPAIQPGWQQYFAFRIAVYVAACAIMYTHHRRRVAAAAVPSFFPACILGMAFCADLGSFRAQVIEAIPPMDPRFDAKLVFHAAAVPYRAERSETPPDDRGRAAVDFLTRLLPYNNSQYCFLYGFAAIDPCRPLLRTDILSRGIDQMILARGGKLEPFPGDEYLPPADAAFRRSLGCGTPKLRLTSRPLYAETEDDAVRLFAALADPDTAVVLSPGSEPALNKPIQGEPGQLGVIQVTAFSSNHLRARVVVEHPSPVWLVYADAWNPGWQARIDGHTAAVRKANLGFKAVQLDNGSHDVEFYFFNRQRSCLAWGVALIGTASGLVLSFTVFAAGVGPFLIKRPLPASAAPTRSMARATRKPCARQTAHPET